MSATTTAKMPTQEQRAEVQKFIERNKLVVNTANNTVRMCKLVNKDGSSSHFTPGNKKVVYNVGTQVVAPDYQPTARCGEGLHFGPTERAAQSYVSVDGPCMVVEVDLDTAVAIDSDKIKARSCYVLGVGNEKNYNDFDLDGSFTPFRQLLPWF